MQISFKAKSVPPSNIACSVKYLPNNTYLQSTMPEVTEAGNECYSCPRIDTLIGDTLTKEVQDNLNIHHKWTKKMD